MKRVRFNRLLASTALGLGLMLASHPSMAQQSEQQKIDAGVPVPDTTLPPPPTVKDLTPKAEQQNAVAPAADAPKADAALAAPSQPKAEAKTETKTDTTSEPKADSASAPQVAPEPVQKLPLQPQRR